MPQAESVAIPKRWPLIVQPENRDDNTAKDSKLINAYVERDADNELYVYKRPGLLQTGSTLSGAGRGLFNWQGRIYAIFGDSLYYDGNLVTSGLNTAGGMYRFSQTAGANPYLLLGNGAASYTHQFGGPVNPITGTSTVTAPNFQNDVAYTIVTTGTTNFTRVGAADSNPGTAFTAANLGTAYAGTFVTGLQYEITSVGSTDWVAIGAAANVPGEIFIATGAGSGTGVATASLTGTGTASTTSNFPSDAVKGWAYLDGTVYVMNVLASVRGCAELNDPTDWSDILNRLTAQIEADNGVFLAQQLVYVVALGQWSTEFFYDALNPTGSPLGPVQGAKINYGCVNGDSVQEIDGMLFWIATNRSAAAQVLMVDQLKPTIVSTKPIERILGAADLTSIYSFGIKYGGHRFYGFTLRNNNITLVYDATDRQWAQWTDSAGNYWPIVASTYLANTGTVVQHESNGKLYLFNSAYVSDDGAAISAEIYTPNFDGGTRRRKQLNYLEFVADQTEGSVLEVSYNDNDYQRDAWSLPRRVNLGEKRPILINNGTFIRRAYHIKHRCATRLRLQAVELQVDVGTL